MTASIIIPSYRGATKLATLLPALSVQTESDFEALVVIDGVFDDSAIIVRRHGDNRIRTVVLPQNRGRVTALNTGFAEASGDVLLRCDDDLEPGPGWLAAHVAAHRNSRVGVVGLTRNVYDPTPWSRLYGEDADRRHTAWAHALPTDQRWRLWAANCSITRGVWDEIGPYDPRYVGYGWEDVDYGYRLHRAGIPIEVVAGAAADHHAAAVDTRTRTTRAFASGAARRVFEQIHGTGAAGPPLRPGGVWGLAVRSLAAPLNERRTRAVANVVDALIDWAPRPVATKLVALAVESAGVAGQRHDRSSGKAVPLSEVKSR